MEGVMRVTTRFGRRVHSTPHYGGSDEDKVEYEYAAADDFWEAMEYRVTLADLSGKDVLDVGCGWGGKIIRYAELGSVRRVAGFDLPGVFDPEVPTGLAAKHGVANCHFTTGYAEDIPFGSSEFDVAIMEDVLEHVADPIRVLGECLRVLRPGGMLVARFPSFRMATAHHLDRALSYPWLHYLVPLRVWAAGLNDYLLRYPDRASYEPFSRVHATPYRTGITRDLNGLDLASFRRIVTASGFEIREIALAKFPRKSFKTHRWQWAAYEILRRIPSLREPLARTLVFVGLKPR